MFHFQEFVQNNSQLDNGKLFCGIQKFCSQFAIHTSYRSITKFPTFDPHNATTDHFQYESVDRPPLYVLLTFSEHRESTLIYRTLPIDPYLTRTK